MRDLSLTRSRVAVDGGHEDGLLVFAGDMLVAVLASLDADFYASERGQWHLEAGFGPCSARPLMFETLEAALQWIAVRLSLDPEATVQSALVHLEQCEKP